MDELFEKIGGFDGVEVMAEDFTMRVLNDAAISGYFASFDSDRMTEMHRVGMALLLGASSHDDIWIRDFSRKLITQTGFSDVQFDRMTQHLVDTLYAHNLRNRDIAKVIDFIQSKRNVVLMRDQISAAQRSHLSLVRP